MQGLQIKLRHRVTLTFDLFTPKVDRFIPRSVDHSCQFVAKPFLSASLYTLVKEALIEIGCVVTSRSLVGWLVVTRVHCGQTVHPRPIVTMEH